MNGRNRGELQWQLIRTFFRSRRQFLAIFERYEVKVLGFAESLKIDRSRLRLPAGELLGLLDFRSLEELRDREVLSLKQTAHDLFRGRDRTDALDHDVSNIYHELSILKEEHYTLKEEHLLLGPAEYNRFFREVSEYYPKRLRHVLRLYSRALRRLEELLPQMAREQILVRSLYLFGTDLLEGQYPGGLAGIYEKMYRTGGEAEGLAAAARSLTESGFTEEALRAWRQAEDAALRRPNRRGAKRLLEEIREAIGRLSSEDPAAGR